MNGVHDFQKSSRYEDISLLKIIVLIKEARKEEKKIIRSPPTYSPLYKGRNVLVWVF